MANTSATYGGLVTVISEAPESIVWVNPNNIMNTSGVYATVTSPTYDTSTVTRRLEITNFNFNIDNNPGASIDGIHTQIRYRYDLGGALDYRVQLINGTGSYLGNNKKSSSPWSSTLTTVSYGSSSDVWGASLTPTIINSSTFGIAFSVTATSDNTDITADWLNMTIYYTAGTLPPAPTSKIWGHTRRIISLNPGVACYKLLKLGR